MCGVVGIYGKSDVSIEIYDALTVLQHRGQDAAGIATYNKGRFNMRRSSGYVRSVFQQQHIDRLKGNIGIGHVRYPTAGSNNSDNTQPFYVNSPYGLALSHNGNLVNADELRRLVVKKDKRHLITNSDSEVLLNALAHELQTLNKSSLKADDIFQSVEALHRRCVGAYACVVLIAKHGLLGFRDPHGIRPLVIGRREIANKPKEFEYILASESAALSILGYELINDVAPGEAVFIDINGQLHRRVCAENASLNPCIFEHVYLSRPDSMIDGIHLYKTRLRQGEYLADKIQREWSDHDIDVVIPIPDTSRVASQALAEKLNLKVREGLMKNRYIGRTFIMSNQKERKHSVKQKLNPIELEFKDKAVLLVDDSIVRGTTAKEIIAMVRKVGARKVYIASAAPMVRYPNVYGIDMPSVDELAACKGKGDEEVIAKDLGADKIIFQDLDDLIKSSQEGNHAIEKFECSVFTGEYITGEIDDAYFRKLKKKRSDKAKIKASKAMKQENDESS